VNTRRQATRTVIVVLIVVLATSLAIVLAGCSSNLSSSPSVTGSTVETVATTPTTAATSETAPPVTLSPYDKELARTAKAAHDFAQYLTDNGANDADPQLAVLYGLRARTVALSCRNALTTNDLASAAVFMREARALLNQGRNLAEADVAEILEQARQTVETLGDPADDPTAATTKLDEFVTVLSPLLTTAADTMGASVGTTTPAGVESPHPGVYSK
jgi:hypothetical protein